jgi:Uncharacterized protein conserved in bacteria (DUF2059)
MASVDRLTPEVRRLGVAVYVGALALLTACATTTPAWLPPPGAPAGALTLAQVVIPVTRDTILSSERLYGVLLASGIDKPGRSTLQKSARQSGPILFPEGPGDTLEDRRVATERLLTMMDFHRLYGDMARGAVRMLPSETDRARAYGAMSDGYEKARVEQFDQLTRYFTRREIDAMTRFYGSPVGQGVFVRMALFLMDAMRLIIERIGQAGSTLR